MYVCVYVYLYLYLYIYIYIYYIDIYRYIYRYRYRYIYISVCVCVYFLKHKLGCILDSDSRDSGSGACQRLSRHAASSGSPGPQIRGAPCVAREAKHSETIGKRGNHQQPPAPDRTSVTEFGAWSIKTEWHLLSTFIHQYPFLILFPATIRSHGRTNSRPARGQIIECESMGVKVRNVKRFYATWCGAMATRMGVRRD